MKLRSPRVGLATAIVAAVLLAQIGLNIWQHTTDTRYFAWAPNDYLVTFDLSVDARGRSLGVAEIGHRYRLDMSNRLSESTKAKLGLARVEHYVYEDAPQELKDRIRRYEETKGKNEAARVTLTYQFDGRKEQTWLWPS
jgi:hypothetical protein